MARSNRRSGRTSRNSHRNLLGNTNRTKSAPRKSTFLFGAVALVSIAIVVLVGAGTRYVSPPPEISCSKFDRTPCDVSVRLALPVYDSLSILIPYYVPEPSTLDTRERAKSRRRASDAGLARSASRRHHGRAC
jgi:hypothetical protein